MGAGKGGQDFSRRQVLSTAGLAAVAVPLAANGWAATWAAASKGADWPAPRQRHNQPAKPARDNRILATPGIGRWKANRAVPRSGRTSGSRSSNSSSAARSLAH
jgi:hypothetical protein